MKQNTHAGYKMYTRSRSLLNSPSCILESWQPVFPLVVHILHGDLLGEPFDSDLQPGDGISQLSIQENHDRSTTSQQAVNFLDTEDKKKQKLCHLIGYFAASAIIQS